MYIYATLADVTRPISNILLCQSDMWHNLSTATVYAASIQGSKPYDLYKKKEKQATTN